MPPGSSFAPGRPFRILSIDGGGIRGIVPAEILALFEVWLREEAGDPTLQLADVFDLVAGTSTGGIIVCLLLCPDPDNPSRPRHDAKYAANLYRERGAEIFSRGWFHRLRTLGGLLDEKYPAAGLERVLADSLGTARLSSLLLPSLITAYDIHRRRAVMFLLPRGRPRPCRGFLPHRRGPRHLSRPHLLRGL